MGDLPVGLYEVLITKGVAAQLEQVGDRFAVAKEGLSSADAADRIAIHLARIVERSIESVSEKKRVQVGTLVAIELLDRLGQIIDVEASESDHPLTPATMLKSVLRRLPDGSAPVASYPLIPLLDTLLLTNSPGEPRVGRQVQAEILSADRIDLLMAFVRRTGLNPLKDSLRRHVEQGRALRVLTTTYTGSTERAALDLLRDLGADVRVSYDTSSTRLHAKAWLFQRHSGFSTAYIGSSNLTHSAQVSGLEWNVRLSEARNKLVIDKVRAVFESYWASDDFRLYDPDEFDERTKIPGASGPLVFLSPVEVTPRPFQERLLEKLQVSRDQGYHRNLLVAATGTGKTIMAGLDYARLRKALSRDRLLFVAHRKEILSQSHAAFRHILRDPSFGELWVGGAVPKHFDHVFASIQSLSATGLAHLEQDHFDVVIVDEFHHAAADSYERLLRHAQPRQLLGLTATPERTDCKPILQWFDHRIAAELRLWDAIDQHYLVPFHYFGVADGTDLSILPWKRGGGYDVDALTKLYTADKVWAKLVVKQVVDKVADPRTMRALGFCAGIRHAEFMARVFNEARIPAVAVSGKTPARERDAALSKLADGEISIVFSVDLFNEGIDVPTVDTLLLLRPTDSPVLFLQQLGRGLRRSDNKAVCTVLDFVGEHQKQFRVDVRYRALLGGTRKDLRQQVQRGFPFLPAGCHMELDAVATDTVLRNIKESVPSSWSLKVAELRRHADAGQEISLRSFLEHSGFELDDIYDGGRSWSDLQEDAGIPVAPSGPEERRLRRAVGRLGHIDDKVRLQRYGELLARKRTPHVSSLGEYERRLWRMLVAQLADQMIDKASSLEEATALIWSHPQVRNELVDLFATLSERLDHVHHSVDTHPDVPLQIHARYTRIEILAALGTKNDVKVGAWQTGVQWMENAKTDLFAFTLDKTSGNFSPTTRYRDYAISRDRIHWESQSVTREDSGTGQRYQHHVELGSHIMLFARLKQSERAFWFLGPAVFVRHEGERPMAVEWRLLHPLPGDLYSSFAAAVA